MPSEDTEKIVNPAAMTANQRAILEELSGVRAVGEVSDLDDTKPLSPEELAAFEASLNQLAENLGGKTRGEVITKINELAELGASFKLKKKD